MPLLTKPTSQKLPSQTESMRYSFLPESERVPKQVQESPSTEPDEKARKYYKGNFCERILKLMYLLLTHNHKLVVAVSSPTIRINGVFPSSKEKKN